MRLIDADALKSYMDECSKESRFRVYYGYAESFINDAPTIDAVPVVRCGNASMTKDEVLRQFRTVDDLGRICIPKDIRDKLGIKPGTECVVYSTDELTSEKIIVIRRNKNDKH